MNRPASILSGLLLMAASASAVCQGFPDRPVHIVVPFPPGGGVDVMIRAVANGLSAKWKQPVVVENKAGAGGIIGTDFVARAPADGYTLLATTDQTVTTNRFLYRKLPYDPDRSLAPVTLMVRGDHLLLANPALSARTLKALMALAKAQPGRISYGSFGAGTQPHLAFAALAASAGVDLIHVPYKGVGPAITAVVGGEVSLTSATAGVAGTLIQGGKLRPIAFTGTRRSKQFPDVPTTAEQGFPQIRIPIWYAVFAPAGTPGSVIDRLNADINGVIRQPEFVAAQIAARGLELVASTPTGLAAARDEGVAQTAPMIRAAKIQPE